MKSSPSILILGATGMVGHTVYNYLKEKYGETVFGTSQGGNSDLFFLSIDAAEKDFQKIREKLKHIDYVINCIGKLQDTKDPIELIAANALFPHLLESLAEKYQYKLLHISTDAVFAEDISNADEKTHPSPTTPYGKSKRDGETTSSLALTIRSSFLGLDPLHHRGLLEWIKHTNNNPISGYTNHMWSGCTTLQFAKLCHLIIERELFSKMRSTSPIVHFVPLSNFSKYTIIETFINQANLHKVVKKTNDKNEITRTLTSLFSDRYFANYFLDSLPDAFAQLLSFESVRI